MAPSPKTLFLAAAMCFVDWSALASSVPCPSTANISPCKCHHVEKQPQKYEIIVSCRGPVSLTNLTVILREKLCGLEIDKFYLVTSTIQYLPSNLFYKVRVRDIQISSTNISHFTEAGRSAFYGLESTLETLSMRKCGLVDKLKWEKIGDLHSLNSLDLSVNTLTEIPRKWFLHPPRNLRFLYLKQNRINYIHPLALSNMLKLMVLDLSENHISSIQRSMFPFPANSITYLRLSYNNLDHLPTDFFHEMYGLKRLYLDHNNLKTLDKEVWSSIWSELNTLDVLDNQLSCDCSISWISNLYPIRHLYGSCTNSETMVRKELRSLYPWHFNCTEDA